MTDAPEPVVAHAMFKVLAALAELGEDTAAAVADKAGLGYSTATAKLRAWEKTGQTERLHTDSKRAVWRLTDAGHATVGTTAREPTPAGAPDTPPAQPAEPSDRDGDLPEVADATAVPEPEPAPQGDTSADDGARAEVAHTVPAPKAQATPQGEASDADTCDEATAEPEPPASTGGPTPDTDADPSTARPRRAKGSLRGALLDVLEAHPDQAFKTSELCKLIDAANAGTGAKKASAGAVANAADTLVIAGKAIRTNDKHATFQLAPATP
ncbi:MarR family transcriptional regulator [Micromonospora sp. HUAS LYJ1]|uniref:MarR family transcriptional regulator n=1 Tax=Micromonospora sp. HUAS LYJ1 TaxID=3061626 RepID=UPI00267229A6|nr:MarR family transcriptional regulator [Micromonospora sp. HUAS LYJ1]WKU03430.1 MarR family transcriptional regulator [Micromonospora sp. HUAS LYJ1]